MAEPTCLQCGSPVPLREPGKRGRQRIYCSKRCGSKASRDRITTPCTVENCIRPRAARGLCYSHYGTWHRKVNGRKRNAEYFTITCVVCGASHQAARRESKFCSDACKGKHYSETMRTRSKLPSDHPVMLLIAESRKPKPRVIKPDVRTPRECPGCASWFSPLHRSAGHMLYCSETCAKRASRRRRRAREHNVPNQWRWSDFMRIARKFDYCCAYCGIKPERLDPDHVVPLSRGGMDCPANLLPACLMCNSSKCAMTLPEWEAWLAARGKEPRATRWERGDSRYTHLTDAVLHNHAA